MSEIAQNSQENYDKCQEVLGEIACKACDLAGKLMILNDFLEECDPLGRDEEDFFRVFCGIQQTISSATECAKEIHKTIIDADIP